MRVMATQLFVDWLIPFVVAKVVVLAVIKVLFVVIVLVLVFVVSEIFGL